MNRNEVVRRFTVLALVGFCAANLTGCATELGGGIADQLNPYADGGNTILGERTTNAINEGGGGKTSEQARHSLEVLGAYRRAQSPQPYYPVVQPSEVRLMWVPDHLNRYGDLVPAHYYYVRVLNDRWAVQDAFEVERQYSDSTNVLNYAAPTGAGGPPAVAGALPPRPSGSGPDTGSGAGAGATPWVYREGK